jgi:hypothetical protein
MDVTPHERFISRIAPANENGCTLWTGGTFADGYGCVVISRRAKRAHRLAWELHHGPIPDGLLVCHMCDTPLCVNVEHLFLGTAADNNADRDRKGRTRYQVGVDRYNVRLTPEEVLAIRASTGVSQYQLAATYGVARTTIQMILNRRSWAHL